MPQSLQKKSGTIGGFSASSCFAVNISGVGLAASPANSCDPSYGLMSKLVPPGGTVEIETSFGQSRAIELYYIVSDQGCGSVPTNGLGETYGSNNIFRVSKVEGIDFNQPEVVVEMKIEWPSTSNSLETLLNTPVSCRVGGPTIDLMAVRQARVVLGAKRALSTSGDSMMNIRVLEQKIDMNSPSNWSGRILPVRLGEE